MATTTRAITMTTIDLSTLEQNDTVVFRDGQKAIVNHMIDLQNNNVRIFAFMIYKGTPANRDMYYSKDGCPFDKLDSDIIEIIKNPKRWTDADMRASYLAGIDAVDFDGDVFDSFGDWLEQYKESKNETN